jgi:hypothetical protein
MRLASDKAKISILLLTAVVFGVAFNLALFSSNLVSMSLGDQALARQSFISGWASILFQPWILFGMWLESITGQYHLHMGWVSSTLTGLGSAAILAGLSWFLLRHRSRLFWSVVTIWSILAILNLIDLKHTTSILAEADASSSTAQ